MKKLIAMLAVLFLLVGCTTKVTDVIESQRQPISVTVAPLFAHSYNTPDYENRSFSILVEKDTVLTMSLSSMFDTTDTSFLVMDSTPVIASLKYDSIAWTDNGPDTFRIKRNVSYIATRGNVWKLY